MPTQTDEDRSTRDRILDIALELFIEQGYDKTSLREIAERLGYSKAAIYYHFRSKDEILLELHLRIHALGRDLLAQLGDSADSARWASVLGEMIEEVLEHSQLFLLHERNRTAMAAMHDSDRHTAEHDDLEATIRAMLRDRTIPVADRVRRSGAIAMVTSGVVFLTEFEDVTRPEYAAALKAAVKDLLWPEGGAS